MDLVTALHVTPIYVAILGLLFIPFTMRAGMYRVKAKIFLGTGDDPELLRRVRGQANFVETVPIALFILIAMELVGVSSLWLHVLGVTLVTGRVAHYVGLTELGPSILRVFGMIATLATILVGSIWLLVSGF